LILVTGASGEGKSTTLASMAQTIAARRSVNMVTIEDPIEFVHSQGRSLVNQREVGSDARDFASALKNALRQDADVIIVGELRDLDTIQTAITAAETGHLVIGTMHTNDAPTAIGRIIDAVPKEGQQFVSAQLAWSLLGVVCQYLLPRSGPDRLGFGYGIVDSELGSRGVYPSGAAFADTRTDSNRRQGRHAYRDESLIELLLA
jgi:twitching motility protein PilT